MENKENVNSLNVADHYKRKFPDSKSGSLKRTEEGGNKKHELEIT